MILFWMDSLTSHLNPVHADISYCFKINFNVIFIFVYKSPNWSLSFSFYSSNFVCISSPLGQCICPGVLSTTIHCIQGQEYGLTFFLYTILKKITILLFSPLLCCNIQETTRCVLSSETGHYVVWEQWRTGPCIIMWVVPDVLKECTALILKGQYDQSTFLWNVGNRSPDDDVSLSIRPEFPSILAMEVIPLIFV